MIQGDLWLRSYARDPEIWNRHATSMQKLIARIFEHRALLLSISLYNMTVDSSALVALVRAKVAVE